MVLQSFLPICLEDVIKFCIFITVSEFLIRRIKRVSDESNPDLKVI